MIDPRKASKVETAQRQGSAGSDLDSDDDWPAARRGGRTTGKRQNIRTGTLGRDSDDSDFDL